MVPVSLNINPDSDEAKRLGKQIKEFYFGDQRIDNKTIANFVDFMTDIHFTVPMTMTNELHAVHQPNSRQFIYEFCYDGELNAFKKLLKMDHLPGACHFDEIFYLFDPKVVGMKVAKGSEAWKIREIMCKLWTNFAKFGDPTPDSSNPLTTKWKPVDPAVGNSAKIKLDYLTINRNPQMKQNLYEHRVDFWRGVYEKYNKSLRNPKFLA